MNAEPPPDADALIRQMESYVRSAADMLEAGHYEKLPELETRVREIATAIAQAPPTRQLADRLGDVRKQLDLLRQLMEQHQRNIQDQLTQLNASRKANHAYARSETIKPKDSDR